MKQLTKKDQKTANALLQFRNMYIKTEQAYFAAKAKLAIHKALFEKLDPSKKAHVLLGATLATDKENAVKELQTIGGRKKYLKSAIAILSTKLATKTQ